MPNRLIKESIRTSDKVNQMSDFQFRLWVHLITYVDDYGRGDARPAIIRGNCFPLRERLTNKDIEAALNTLAGIGCVSLYEVDGKPYLYFPNWGSHQQIRNKKSKYPAPPDGMQKLDSNCNQLPSNAPVIQSNTNTNPNMNPNHNICAEQAHALVVARLPLNTGDYFEITEDHVSEWSRLYPAVDVRQAINDMLGWLNANPRKRKTKSGILNFCNSWLAKNQNRGGNTASAPSSKWSTPEGPTRDDFERLLKMKEELKGGTR